MTTAHIDFADQIAARGLAEVLSDLWEATIGLPGPTAELASHTLAGLADQVERLGDAR